MQVASMPFDHCLRLPAALMERFAGESDVQPSANPCTVAATT